MIEKVINEFCPRFTPGGKPVYVGDTHKKWAYFDAKYLRSLGVTVEEHGKMPDLVAYFHSEAPPRLDPAAEIIPRTEN